MRKQKFIAYVRTPHYPEGSFDYYRNLLALYIPHRVDTEVVEKARFWTTLECGSDVTNRMTHHSRDSLRHQSRDSLRHQSRDSLRHQSREMTSSFPHSVVIQKPVFSILRADIIIISCLQHILTPTQILILLGL